MLLKREAPLSGRFHGSRILKKGSLGVNLWPPGQSRSARKTIGSGTLVALPGAARPLGVYSSRLESKMENFAVSEAFKCARGRRVLSLILGSAIAVWAADPVVGTWELNVAKSNY